MQLIDYNTKNIIALIIKTLSIYAILSVFFYCYVGLVDPNGGYYSPFLAKFSLIQFILNALAYPLVWILELLGYEATVYNNHVNLVHGGGISIYFACLGIDIMIGYVSLVLGYPGIKKTVVLIAGLIFVHVLNIVRMLMILFTLKTNPNIVEQSHDVFNMVAYGCIIVFYYIWVIQSEKYNKLAKE